MPRPPSNGRQKISIKKIENKATLRVTFAKRRPGLFKKADELVSLCGAEIAILLFSPGNKAFSYGHPGVRVVFDRVFKHVKREEGEDDDNPVNKRRITELQEELQAIENLIKIEMDIGKGTKKNVAKFYDTKINEENKLKLCGLVNELQLKISSANMSQQNMANGFAKQDDTGGSSQNVVLDLELKL